MTVYSFSQSATNAVADNFINKMTQHLVPKYFSRIETTTSDDGLYYIQAYDNDDVLIFKMRTWGSSSAIGQNTTTGISFYDKSSNVWRSVANICGSSGTAYLTTAYVCTGGIYFRSYTGYPDLITKSYGLLCIDNQNNPAFIQFNTENTGNTSITASVFTQSGYLSYALQYNDKDNTTGSYYLIPFFAKNGIIKRVWCPLIEQYNSVAETLRIMQLDSKDYFVMPAFLIEDF